MAESTPQSTQRCRATLLPQAWFAYSARCLARAVDAAVYRRTRPVRRTQALCLARSPPYDVCSRSDDLAGARIPPRPQQPSASTARARGSHTSWPEPRRRPRRRWRRGSSCAHPASPAFHPLSTALRRRRGRATLLLGLIATSETFSAPLQGQEGQRCGGAPSSGTAGRLTGGESLSSYFGYCQDLTAHL